MTQAYPLHWPLGFPRTKYPGYSKFRTGLDAASANVVKSLRAFASDSGKDIVNLVVSSLHLYRCKRKDGHGIGGLFCRQHALDATRAREVAECLKT